MVISFEAFAVAAAISFIAASRIPAFDVEGHCRDVAARAAPIGDSGICVRKEWAARDQLVRQWERFSAADRQRCLELARMGEPTYTELLTCLELAAAVKDSRDRSTSGERRP